MRTPTGRVLVLGTDTRAFLSVIRSLGRGGLEVHTAGAPVDSPALRSKYVHKIHHLPVFRSEDETWLVKFKDLMREHDYDLVLPCSDPFIIPLQLKRRSLGELATRVYLTSDYAFEITNDKLLSYSLTEKLAICRPRQQVVYSPEQLKETAMEFGFPLVIKPLSSFTWNNLDTKQMVREVQNETELADACMLLTKDTPVIVQEFFAGVGAGVEVLCRNGEILAAFQHERIHEPPRGGGSSYRKSVPLHPELLDATQKLMTALEYTGVCMVEFRINKKSGLWAFVEMNGRFWGSLPLAIAAGANFPLYLYQMLCLGITKFPRNYNNTLFCRNWVNDLGWLRLKLRSSTQECLRPATLANALKQTAKFLTFREASDTFVRDDLAPAWNELRPLFTRVALSAGSRVLPVAIMSRRRAKVIADHRSILFVCKGNVCRSPFAATLFASRFGNTVGVHSAGFQPGGRPAPPAAVEAAKSWELDLTLHRSMAVTQAQLDSADMIFIFDFHQAAIIRHIFPRSASKVFLLGSFDRGPLQIEDPWGKSLTQFREIYARIDDALKQVETYL